jgi:transitional endoplasmic reticulum ATPase
MSANISPPGDIARVTRIAADGTVYVTYQSGRMAWITGHDEEVRPEDIVLVDTATGFFEVVDSELWKDVSHVGVVRRRTDEFTLIEVGNLIVKVPPSELDYEAGYTVEWSERVGVSHVLDRLPLRAHEPPDIEQSVVDAFKREPRPGGPGFADFGGMRAVVNRARDLIEAPLVHGEQLEAIRARPIKGVLFTGDPGTGKTHLARIIANQAQATFYEISGPSIISKWVGESERLVRAIFADAAEQDRSIVFFDEIDSVATRRTGESHEASRRVVAQLLTEIDGFAPASHVVVVGATNRPDDLDPALRRPGRLDWEVDFPIPDRDDREDILRVRARDLEVTEGLPHSIVAERTEGWTPADLEVIWSEAALLAVKDGRSIISVGDYLGGLQQREAQRASRTLSHRRPENV